MYLDFLVAIPSEKGKITLTSCEISHSMKNRSE